MFCEWRDGTRERGKGGGGGGGVEEQFHRQTQDKSHNSVHAFRSAISYRNNGAETNERTNAAPSLSIHATAITYMNNPPPSLPPCLPYTSSYGCPRFFPSTLFTSTPPKSTPLSVRAFTGILSTKNSPNWPSRCSSKFTTGTPHVEQKACPPTLRPKW